MYVQIFFIRQRGERPLGQDDLLGLDVDDETVVHHHRDEVLLARRRHPKHARH
jgi:hypothetical protein